MEPSIRRFEEIEARATQWLIKLDAERTPEAMAEHSAWMAENPHHQVAYAKLSLAWKRMDALKRMRPLDPPGAVDPDLLKPKNKGWLGVRSSMGILRGSEGGRPMKKKSWLAAWMPRVGISVALAAILAIYVVMLAPRSSGRSYETQVGDQQQVTLDDGTTLTLNTNTRVRVQYSAERRKILLDRGEILLSVAHDASRPLEVIAAGVVSRAVGTKFSVRLHEDASVETVVTEGRVLVLGQRNVLGMPMEPKPLAPTLVAGEHAVVNAKSTQVSHLTAQEMKGLLMWTTGRIVFQREKLSTVVRELNRYNVRQLTIRDARISETRIGGGFETSHADAYAQDLTIFFGNTALASQQPAPER